MSVYRVHKMKALDASFLEQTEGRVGILKIVFLEGTPRAKDFKNRQLQVELSVLSHNL